MTEEKIGVEEEIRAYRQVNNDYLTGLYEPVNLGSDDPEGRAKYLAETVLDLTMSDHDLLMTITHYDGRPAALNLLEEIVIAHGD